MATKFYFSNSTTPATPGSWHGNWEDSSAPVTQKLDTVKSGTLVNTGSITETDTTGVWDVRWGRWVSDHLDADVTFTGASAGDTWRQTIGVLESDALANMYQAVFIWVWNPDPNNGGGADVARGVLYDSDVGETDNPGVATNAELPTTAAGQFFNGVTTN